MIQRDDARAWALIQELQSIDRQEMRREVLTWSLLKSYPRDLRQATVAAAIPHWFDASILTALLPDWASEAEALYRELQRQHFVEPYASRGHTLHKLTRQAVLGRLWHENPDHYRLLSERVRNHLVQTEEPDPAIQIETLYHLLVVDEEKALDTLTHLHDQFRNVGARYDLAEGLLRVVIEQAEAERLSQFGRLYVRLEQAVLAAERHEREQATSWLQEVLDEAEDPELQARATSYWGNLHARLTDHKDAGARHGHGLAKRDLYSELRTSIRGVSKVSLRVLLVSTYYDPHVSGLTIYVKRLATALAMRGNQVTVLTSRYDPALPAEEVIDGVCVLRAPVWFRVSKGVIMPSFPSMAWQLIRDHDVVSIHLPQFEASLLSLLGRLAGRPVVLTYHCDLQLPKGRFSRVVDRVVFVSNYVAGHLAQAAVAHTPDFVLHSHFLSRFLDKVHVIPPPVIMPAPDQADEDAFRLEHDLEGRQVVGMAARLATEEGVEVLIEAMPRLLQTFPRLKVLFAGQYQDVIGEEAYYNRLMPMIRELGPEHWEFLGVLTQDQMPAFYAACDVLVVPSLNSTESFGLVQVEAMLCGTPSIASNLPGVRHPPKVTGMGEVTLIGDSEALAEAIIRIIQRPNDYAQPRAVIQNIFRLDRTISSYEVLFAELVANQVPESQTAEIREA